MSFTKKAVAGAVLAGAFMFTTVAPANAQPEQDGLVNVVIGDVTILEDVRVAVAAQVAAAVCGVSVGPVAILGRAVDRSGDTETICEPEIGDVLIEQN